MSAGGSGSAGTGRCVSDAAVELLAAPGRGRGVMGLPLGGGGCGTVAPLGPAAAAAVGGHRLHTFGSDPAAQGLAAGGPVACGCG